TEQNCSPTAASHFGVGVPLIHTNGLAAPSGTRPTPPHRGHIGSGAPNVSCAIARLATMPAASEPATNERRGMWCRSFVIGQASLASGLMAFRFYNPNSGTRSFLVSMYKLLSCRVARGFGRKRGY